VVDFVSAVPFAETLSFSLFPSMAQRSECSRPLSGGSFVLTNHNAYGYKLGVGGSSGVVNCACRCSAGGDTSERCRRCWYESLQLQAFLLVVVV
jgi:hypothetical protein